jgi:hypothetical protein
VLIFRSPQVTWIDWIRAWEPSLFLRGVPSCVDEVVTGSYHSIAAMICQWPRAILLSFELQFQLEGKKFTTEEAEGTGRSGGFGSAMSLCKVGTRRGGRAKRAPLQTRAGRASQ